MNPNELDRLSHVHAALLGVIEWSGSAFAPNARSQALHDGLDELASEIVDLIQGSETPTGLSTVEREIHYRDLIRHIQRRCPAWVPRRERTRQFLENLGLDDEDVN